MFTACLEVIFFDKSLDYYSFQFFSFALSQLQLQIQTNENKRLYNIYDFMVHTNRIVLFFALVALTLSIVGIGLNSIRPLHLNKGLSTKYMFFINPQTQILTKANVQITFPKQFDLTKLAANLSCMASSLSYSWISVSCRYQQSSQSVIVSLGTIKNEDLSILVSQPTNPTTKNTSSDFSVCLMADTMVTDCRKLFGKVVFPDAPTPSVPAPTSTYPDVSSLNTVIVGQSSTYQFKFSLSKSYSVNNTIRITFPQGFQTTSSPICQVTGNYTQQITTYVWPDQRTVQCQNINKTLYLNETVKVVGVKNPPYAGIFGNFVVQLLTGTTTIVNQQQFLIKTVTIAAGSLTGMISQANNFISGDVQYTFYLNLLNSLTSNNFILIRFQTPWILYSGMCQVISGITMAPKTALQCSNYTSDSYVYLNVSNFLSASVSNQLVFSILVRSPSTLGVYSVQIQTANAKGVVDFMTTNVTLNSTYGDYQMLSINAIVAQSNVPVSGTGPLELTFFLNYNLPQTNVLTYGKFQLKIYPQIPLPPPLINGVLKCYFFNTIPAQTCTWDTTTSLSYTLVTINTPLTQDFQYSQIPLTITTEGAVNSSKIGITIADIVTRYRFELQMFQQNSSSIPTQVYFSQYIAAPILLPITYYSLTKEANEYTHLRFQFTSPYNITTPLADDLRIKIQFLSPGGGWAPNLGFSADTSIKNFPCVFSGNKAQLVPPQYNSKVSCDLYTYVTGPHASLTNSSARGPYILVGGFSDWMLINSQVRLELGGFLIGSSTNVQANVRFSLVQETPTMLTKYVELYYNEFAMFTVTNQAIATPATGGITDTIGSSSINFVSNHTISYTAPSTFFAAVYQFDMISTPSFPNQFVSCTRVSSTVANWCTYLGYPINWIIQYSYSSFTTSVNSIINITNGAYAGTFTGVARIMSSASVTLLKKNFNIVYNPYTISSALFTSDNASIIYKGSQQYYYISFIPVTVLPDNGFIRFIFGSYGTLGPNPFCTSTSLQPYVAQLGILCSIQTSTSLKIYNIMGLSLATNYSIKVRIYSDLSSGSNFRPSVTIQTHYSINADPSIVNQINTLLLNVNPTNYYNLPNEFKINNPRTSYQTTTLGYIGKFQVQFSPSADILTSYSIKMIFNDHAWNGGIWSTPNSVTSDPLVCLINYVRVACTYTLSPLTVTMNVNPATINNGQSNMITIDTQYLRYNGILHPSQGGQYNLYMQFYDVNNSLIQKQSFYHQVLPSKLRNFYVNSSVNDVGVENMLDISFELLSSPMVNAFNDGTMYSRIYIQFPTVDSLGNTLFANNLGGYQSTGEIVGCAFDTWSSVYNVGAVGGYRPMCRLIMSQSPGQPTRVEILHQNAFSTSSRYMRFWIAKVFNPSIAVTSIPISIRINHVQVSTNNVYQLYYDTFDLFMNSQSNSASTFNTIGCQGSQTTFFYSPPINNIGYVRIYPANIGGWASTGYFFVLDTTNSFKPQSLQPYVNSNNCHGGYYYYCLTFPDINYIVINVRSSSGYFAQIYVQYPNAISQYQTNMVARIWKQYRYMGTQTIQVSPTCWNQIRSGPSSVSIYSTPNSGNDYYVGRRRIEVRVNFNLGQPVPAGGTIQINFPTSVTVVYPHCRSMTNLGSAATVGGASYTGEVGCLVQTTNSGSKSWVITGFNALAISSYIVIVGQIDLPGSGGYLGTGQIITYNNTDPTNIRANGFIIDYWTDPYFSINVNSNPSHNVDAQITLDETLPLRTNYVGPLRVKFTVPGGINGPNAGLITVRIPGVSSMGVVGGFSYTSSKKHVCQIIQANNFQETGCIITSITTDNSTVFPSYLFTMITSGTLSSSTVYKLIITTHTGSQPEGLTFPTTAGTYKVDFNFDSTSFTGFSVHNQLYLQVYGTKWNYILCQQFNSIPQHRNLIWFKITPTTTIQTTQQIIIEIPTKSSAGTYLFTDDLGTGIADGGIIPVDILASPFSTGFMACNLFLGSQAQYKPAKIVCGNLLGTISSSQVLWFALKIVNPPLPAGYTKLSIPFFLYSVEQGTTFKTNFDVIQNAVYLRADYATRNQVAYPASQNAQLQTSGMYLDLISRNYYNLVQGQYYVIFFSFPLRNNGLISGGCTYPGSSTYGDAIYHLNNWAIVCSVTTGTAIGVPSDGYTTRNLRISNFFTPFYYLSSSEQFMVTYAYHFTSRYTTYGAISDGYPNESPKASSTPSMTISTVNQGGTLYTGVRDDYIFTFTYSSSATNDLGFVKKIAIIFPTYIDYALLESDCLQYSSSQVQIASCYIDTTNRVIWIYPVVKSSYTSNMAVSIITRGLAVRNPTVNISTNVNQFNVKYYTWQNISQPSLNTANDNYCYLKVTNFPSSGISYNYNPSSYSVQNFNYIQYTHQRYYLDTPFSSLTHRAPFELGFYPSVTFTGQSGTNYHMIKVVYPSTFTDATMFKIRDTQVFRPVCYLNNQRIRQCAIDTVNKAITLSFVFALSTSTKYHLKVSILDSRNADVNGFLATIAVSNLVLLYKPYGAGTWQYTETDQFPTLYSLPTGAVAGPFRGITAGTTTYGHTVPNRLNFLNMLLTFNRTDITGLVFQIPSIDKNGNALFSSSSDLSNTFLSQQNGGSYPCGNNGHSAGGSVQCYILNGNHNQAGVVTRIIMTGFTYVNMMNCRIVFVNPTKNAVFFSVRVKAFGGIPTANNPYGNQFMGQWEFNQIFQTNNGGSASTDTYTANYYRCPSSSPWRNNTSFYVFSNNQVIGNTRSSVASLLYYDQSSALNDKGFCEPSLGSSNSWDDLLTFQISSGGVLKKYAYFVTTYQSNADVSHGSGTGWTLNYIKCKYFANFVITGYFYFSDTSIQVATNSFSSSYCNGYTSGIPSPTLITTSQSHYNANGTAITYVQEFDITSTYGNISNFNFRNGDQMVLSISYSWNYWGTISSCAVLGGVTSTSRTALATCNVGSNSKLYITNVAGFVTTPSLASSTNMRIKIKFVASTSSADTNNNAYSFYMYLYSNFDAYNQGYQGIFYTSNSLISGTSSSCYRQNIDYCPLMQSTAELGTFMIYKITDTYMQVVMAPNTNLNFGNNVYTHNIVITFNGFTFGSSCTISGLDLEMSASPTPGSGIFNTFPADTITCAKNYFQFYINSRTWSSYWGGNGQASDNIWQTNQYLIMYITVAPSNSDLPKLEHDYIFVHASYNYKLGASSWTSSVLRSLQYTPQVLASSAAISTISNNIGGVSEFSFTLTSLKTKLGLQNNNYLLLAEFIGTSGWTTTNEPFATYTNTNLQTQQIACKCISGSSPLTVSASSPFVDTVCYRRLPSGTFNNYAILIQASASQNQDLTCFFPEFMVKASMSFNVEFKLVYGDTYPDERITATTKYSSKWRIQSNTLSFAASVPNMGNPYVYSFSSSQSTNFYASATNVGSSFTGTYTLSGSWSNALSTPYIYINFKSAGPIPISSFCSDQTIFLQCRVYTSLVYIVVAQLKSTSISSYSISNGGNALSYPPSQFSVSSNYGATIYIGSSGQWSYSSSLSRSQSSLTPISSNSFLVYSDVYGSRRSSYQTNIFISVNPNGQTLYNYALTNSMMVISLGGLTTTQNCQVWVQNQPLVNLKCRVSTGSSTLTVYSPYFDYSTNNNIIISLGVTNPTSASTTFNLVMYSSYYSSTWNYVSISRSATYTTDTTYNSGTYTQISKASLQVYPFQARISTIANAPLRVRFSLASGSSEYVYGQITFVYSQIANSTAHLCSIIAYNSYAAMMQQTQRVTYKVACTSSGSTLVVIPSPTLTLNAGQSYYYELVMMPLNINSGICTANGCPSQSGYLQANFDTANIIVYSNRFSAGIIAQQIQKLYAYEGASYIGLQFIYVLCVQPRITSIYLSININFTSSNNFPSHYLEITLFDLSISSFSGFSVGSIIPCQLSSNFVAVSGRQNPQCRVVSANMLNNVIRVRIENIGPLSPQTYWVTLDDIILPTPTQSDNNNKFDISIAYFGPSNVKYQNYFPQIFQVDNTNSTSPITSSTYTFNTPSATGFGTPITGQVQFNWPFDSSSTGYQCKVALNFNGGYSSIWTSIDTITFLDNSGTYTILWTNKALNKVVFLMPNKGNGVSTTLNISSLKNPYPYQRELYNKNSTNVIINFYNNFFLANSQTFNQPSFASTFSMNPSLIFINQNTPCNSIDNYPSNNTFAPSSTNILILSIEFSQTALNIQARNLGIIKIQFTSGISYIRQCRVMLNTSTYVNTMQICQHNTDGTYWYIYLYDVANSQLTSGWWVQVLGNFTSNNLAYTSQVMASNNNVVQYQSSYTVNLGGYNSSRSIPTVLSWLDNRYVLFFHEVQYRFLDAVTAQKTPYLRFRFTLPVGSSTSSDVFYIYLQDNTAQRPYTPVNNLNNLVVQFLPALSWDRDFSVGTFGDAQLINSGSVYYYAVQMRYGGLNAGGDYLMQISQYNTATTSFYMSTSPNRQQIKWMYQYYPSHYNYQYFDHFYIKSYTRFRFAQFLHTTTTVNDYDTLTINYTPYGSLSAASSNNQITLRLSVQTRYHAADGGVTDIFTADGRTLVSGSAYSGVVSNSAGNSEIHTIQFGQYAINNAPLRFTLSKQPAYVDSTQYTLIIPLMKNPGTAYVTLRYNLTLVTSPNSNYEYIFNMYQSINEYYTVADTSSSMTTSITNNLKTVQSVNSVDLAVSLGSYSLTQWNTAIFKINNALPGLIPTISSPNDTSNYNNYYFKNINMIVAQKKTTNSITNIGIGASSSVINYQSTFGISWVKIFSTSNVPLATNPYTLYYSTPPTLTLSTLTSYSSKSLSLVQGYSSVGSTGFYLATITTPIIPEGGEIRVLFNSTVFSSNSMDACRVGAGFVRSANDYSALRCYKQSQGFRIAGFAAISVSTSIQIYFKLTALTSSASSNIDADVFGKYLDNTTRIALANINTITVTASNVPNYLLKFQSMVIPYFATLHTNEYYLLEGTFNLRTTTLTNSGYLYITEPGWSIYGSRRLLIKQNISSVTGWTQLIGHYMGSNYYRYQIPSNYLMPQQVNSTTQYLFRYTSYSSNPYYNGLVVGAPGVSKFWLTAYSGSAITQATYFDFIPLPQPFVLTVTNRYKAAGRLTMLDLLFTVDVDVASGNQIVISFDTNNLLNQMFANDLEGVGTSGATYRYLDCSQWSGMSVISNSRIVCLLYFGNNLATPPIPASLTISFTKQFYGWSSSNNIRIVVANVLNPSTASLNTGIKANINLYCENQQKKPCSTYEARGFYVTTASTQNVLSTSTSFSSSSSLVLVTGLTHTFTLTLTASLSTTDAIYIIYPQNFQGVMPSTCSVSNYICYVFPTRRWVVLLPTTTIASGSTSLAITSMNNPYYAQPSSLYFKVTVARASAVGDVYYITQNAFTPVSYCLSSPVNSTSATVVTTQTPNMYLRKYANTVIFTINNLFSDSRTRAIYIQAPADVTSWDPTYCNASITATTTSNLNYPLRFTCIVDPLTSNFLRLTLDSDMATFTAGWGLMSIRVHARFTIADFPTPPVLYQTTPVTSGIFYFYSSVSATSSSNIYYMSQTSLTISIIQHQVPIISVVNFNTQSFSNRLARVNNKQVFYLLFKPLVANTIGSIVFTIPSQFNYPGVFTFDNCLMIGSTTVGQPNCQLSRYQGQTLVTLTPTGYDNQVKIFQIGTVSQSNWFTAPSLPGDFYKMNVAVYSPNGTLISKLTKKISPVYGQNLDIPSIKIANVQDKSSTSTTYDLQFITGDLQIPPGALTTATTQTSKINFMFENFDGMNPTNVFANDLRTGLTTGSQVGCLIRSGLTALPGMRLKCLLTVGINQTNKPTISIINYNFVNPFTTINISFAGIQTLPSTLTNTISIGAMIYYNDINSSTYLYIPTPVLTLATQSTNLLSGINSGWASNWNVNASYSGTSIVLQPTIFSVSYSVPYYWTGNIGGIFSNVNYTYYGQYTYTSTGSLDQFILLTFYPATLLDKNNPVTVSCPSCVNVDVHYASGMVRFRHSTSTNSYLNYRTFTFNNFPNSAYSLANQTAYVNFQIFKNYQCFFSRNISVSLPRSVQKCAKFNFGVVSVSSLNGGQVGVVYKFSIMTNHFVPSNGALSITLPLDYGDMMANQATCNLINFDSTNCYCKIATPSRIDIYANGTELSSSTTYSLYVTGLQNPNVQSSNYIFIVTSYYLDNIYLSRKICENQITPPSINIKPLRTCTLSWTPQYYNQNFNATYVFQLSCSDVFRADSILYVTLPQAFSTTNPSGTFPCSSYESTTLVTPYCQITNLNGILTLYTKIDASSQSSLSLIINLVNPINNTYSASAYVTSKGTQYASSTSTSLTILSNSYALGKVSNVELLNTPKQAGLSSTYVFKISPITTFSPTNLGVSFPSNFFIDSTSIKVAIANTEINNFFSYLTYNNIQALISNASAVNQIWINSYPTFTVSGTSVYMNNITSQVSKSKWTYLFVSGIRNPSSYQYANFKVAYYLISNGFQALQWVYQFPLTYYISPPPQYISINKVTVTDFDLLYPANYTFNFSAATGNIGIAGKNLSYIIVIPTFYKSTLWANSAPVCSFAQLSRTSSCYSYQGQIIVTQIFSTNYSTLTLTISTLLNPSLPTNCNTTDTTILAQTFFVIRIIDTLSNSFLFESSSVVDSLNCLTFSSKRTAISLQYSLIMSAGLAYNITYGLTQASSKLKIAASVNNSGFTFSPAVVDFSDFYNKSKSTQLFLRSDVAPGTYVINFQKYQSSVNTSFRNILPVTITVVAAAATPTASSPTISIPTMSDSTVGYPVNIPIQFSLPSSTEMTLLLTITQQQTQTLAQYSSSLSNFSITPRIIRIQPQNTDYSFKVVHGLRIVPPPLSLNLNLTSNYPIVHQLTTKNMYLCFDRDPKYANLLYPPLRVTVTPFLTSCNQQDVGKTITNIYVSNDASASSAVSVTPKIIDISVLSVASTGATLRVSSISSGTIYYLCIGIGYPNVTNNSQIVALSSTLGIKGSANSSALTVSSGSTGQVNFVATVTLSGLSQTSNYVFYAVSNNNLGTSNIVSINFTTTALSNGAQMTLTFKTIVSTLNIVNSLVQVLRITPTRVKVLTSQFKLGLLQAAVGSNDNQITYSYDIVIAPDSNNDIVSPITTIKNFANSKDSLTAFQAYLPSFIIAQIKYFQLMPVFPIAKVYPYTVSIGLYNAKFGMKFQNEAILYAVLYQVVGQANTNISKTQIQLNPVQVKTLTKQMRANVPSSNQIVSGKDNNNTGLSPNKVVKAQTDKNGNVVIYWPDLKPKSTYNVFLTAAIPRSYDPPLTWKDQQVITFNFTTLPNPNLGTAQTQQDYLLQFKKIDPVLGDALLRAAQSNQKKTKTNRNT